MKAFAHKLRWLLLCGLVALAAPPAGAAVDLSSLRVLGPAEVSVEVLSKFYNRRTGARTYQVILTNVSGAAFNGTLLAVIDDISGTGITVQDPSDLTTTGLAAMVLVADGVFDPGAAISRDIVFANAGRTQVSFTVATYLEEVVTDTTAPELEAVASRYTLAASLPVTGVATDDETGVAGVTVTADTAPGQAFPATVAPDGSFSVTVPVSMGDNELTVLAGDLAGNSATRELTVTRVVSPAVSIAEPLDGALTADATLTLRGEALTELPAQTLTLKFRDRDLSPAPPATRGSIPFTFEGVTLAEGANRLTVVLESPVGRAAASVDVEHVPPPADGDEEAPTIAISRPLPGAFVTGDVVLVSGRVADPGGVASVSVNAVPASTDGLDSRDVAFELALDLSGVSGPLEIVVSASDLAGNAGTVRIPVERDGDSPVIDVPGLLPAPAVNDVVEIPYRLEGTVTEPNLASLRANGQPLGLVPGSGPDDYRFTVDVALTAGQEQAVRLDARDLAGNSSTLELELRADVSADVEILSPHDGAEILVTGSQAEVELVARVRALPAGATVEALVDGAQAGAVVFDGDVAVASLTLPAADGAHELGLRVEAADGTLLRRAAVRVVLVNRDTLPVALLRHEPDNGDTDAGVSDPVTLHFNKPIELDRLEVVIRETFHGLTYAEPPGSPADFAAADAALEEVHRDREPVEANPGPLPGAQMVSYFATRDFAFGATVFVEVSYDGAELGRFSYQVQPRPTFVQGLVSDQLLAPIAGLEVALPEHGFSTLTDANGAFNLGSGEPGAAQIPAGRQRLVLNPGLANRAFGTLTVWANVQAGELNNVGLSRVPILNPDVPFQRIESGQALAVLAGGDLELGLGAAQLRFPDQRGEGDVHVQFTNLQEIPVPVAAGSIPHWVFSVQPAGIEVAGDTSLAFAMPALYGSHDYVPANGTFVVLVGLHPNALEIVPIGVGEVRDAWVRSVRAPRLQRLDHLGYALVAPELQDTLGRYAAGEIGLEALIAALEQR